jgi:hypothetical protein
MRGFQSVVEMVAAGMSNLRPRSAASRRVDGQLQFGSLRLSMDFSGGEIVDKRSREIVPIAGA